MPKILISIGFLLITLSVVGLVLAIGNLASLPSTQEQLIQILPNASEAVTQATAQSRAKSSIGIIVCVTTLVCGITFLRRGIRKSHQ